LGGLTGQNLSIAMTIALACYVALVFTAKLSSLKFIELLCFLKCKRKTSWTYFNSKNLKPITFMRTILL